MNTQALSGQRSAVSAQEAEVRGQRSGIRGQGSGISKREKGFTLVELVLVIILIAILASIAVPRFVNLSRQADIAATRGALGAVRGAIVMDYASRTLANRGVAKFSNVVYGSWFFELDVPLNEITNSSVVNVAALAATTTVKAQGAGGCPTFWPSGQTCGGEMRAADITATALVARNVPTVAAATVACNATVAETVPSTGWYYESNGDFEGVVKPCGDNSTAAGFTDDTADVW